MSRLPSGWRSLLFVPQFAFTRAARLSADCFVLDLQDAVPLAAKAAARAGVVEALTSGLFEGRPVVVRINEADLAELHTADLDACVGLPGLTALMPTMTRGPEELDALHERVALLEVARGLPRGHTRFLPLLETPAAVLEARRMALAGGGHRALRHALHACGGPHRAGGACPRGAPAWLHGQVLPALGSTRDREPVHDPLGHRTGLGPSGDPGAKTGHVVHADTQGAGTHDSWRERGPRRLGERRHGPRGGSAHWPAPPEGRAPDARARAPPGAGRGCAPGRGGTTGHACARAPADAR
ncbi:hypothetical protein D7Y13_00650 [Corallococcus praedator]|uniref:HpcH/HpaI aldolase/citrate lyase domain-containing protein n=1 Tax=Corallococcus praedator TaxID=2316724 RepID=A0ABX9QRB6_9BACT|nr:hypothetical protein D7X75_02510 [Corallococcus sp. CA031C]RKI17635.1 hypothetical protein D7Y13_00650 [Corallococcus praedator]